jgi:hypothetical protein
MGARLSVKASPRNGRVYLLIKTLLLSSEYCFVICLEVATQQRLYKLQYEHSDQRLCENRSMAIREKRKFALQ